MGKKKRGRCVKKNLNVNNEPEEVVNAPHSFVINKGIPDQEVLDLTKDFRKVMEPFTAASLKVRKKNTVKDFVSVAGLLHVSHLCVFSRTELGVYLKLARLPRGPTLTFKVHNFSLARDVVSSLKKQMVVEQAFKHSPLIILNSFTGEGMQMKLMASMFQNMFPTINLNNIDLNTVRRCVLMNYNPTTKMIDFRHYNVKVIPAGVSKGVKKVVQGKVPNLSRCKDISELLTKGGMLSESEFEDDATNQVILPQKLASRGNMEQGKSAIRLSELGPRITMQLIKIEDGLLDGDVLYHDLIHKTEEEKAEIKKRLEMKKKLKEKRKRIQEQNKNAKEAKKEEHKEKSLKGMAKNKTETDIAMKKATQEAYADAKMEDDDDAQYYEQEVGEKPDEELFSKSQGTKRPANSFQGFKNKKLRLDEKPGGFKKGFKKFDEKPGGFKKGFKKFDEKPGGFKKGFKKFDDDNRDKKFKRGRKFDDDSRDKKFKGGRKFDNKNKDRKFGGKGRDKTNSHLRDKRPIGGGSKVISSKKKPMNKFNRKRK